MGLFRTIINMLLGKSRSGVSSASTSAVSPPKTSVLTPDEINIAYRTADYERRQKQPMVVGIEVKLSGNHIAFGVDGKMYELSDICDDLAGKYPKGFKFTGWHPLCRCFATEILKTDKELAEDRRRILRGEEPLPSSDSVNTVRSVPEGFKKWVRKNALYISIALHRGEAPAFISDNPKYVKPILAAARVLQSDILNVSATVEKEYAIFMSQFRDNSPDLDEYNAHTRKYGIAMRAVMTTYNIELFQRRADELLAVINWMYDQIEAGVFIYTEKSRAEEIADYEDLYNANVLRIVKGIAEKADTPRKRLNALPKLEHLKQSLKGANSQSVQSDIDSIIATIIIEKQSK